MREPSRETPMDRPTPAGALRHSSRRSAAPGAEQIDPRSSWPQSPTRAIATRVVIQAARDSRPATTAPGIRLFAVSRVVSFAQALPLEQLSAMHPAHPGARAPDRIGRICHQAAFTWSPPIPIRRVRATSPDQSCVTILVQAARRAPSTPVTPSDSHTPCTTLRLLFEHAHRRAKVERLSHHEVRSTFEVKAALRYRDDRYRPA